MYFQSTPVEAKLMERVNRFLGIVDLDGDEIEAYIPNPGRMNELLYPGATVYLIRESAPHRKTDYDMVLVEQNTDLISIDSRVPNIVVGKAIESGLIEALRGYWIDKKEPRYLDSRLDFLLKREEDKLLLEVKSCTLVEQGIALFPDAPTKRGARHVYTLIKALEEGRAVFLVLIQRNDASIFRPHRIMDPEFFRALREAKTKGVEVYAYDCRVNLYGVFFNEPVKVNSLT